MSDDNSSPVDEPMRVPASDELRQKVRRYALLAMPQAKRYSLLAVPLAIIFASGIYLAINNMLLPNPDAVPSEPTTTQAAGVNEIGGDTASVVTDLPTEQAGVPTPEPSDPRWAFLLLGYGGGAHDGAYLTDSMVLAIVDPTKKTLALLSIPRDSWVPLLFDGKTAIYNKLNTAYAFATDQSLYRNRLSRYAGKQGAGSFVVDTVARLTGVPISNYVALDFAGFRQMIDAVGGIDVRIPDSFTASYPANDDPRVDPSWTTVRFVKGAERMNGERAIQFARAREVIDNYAEGTDFARSRRQRAIMEAFKSRLFDPGGLVHLPQVLAIAARRIDTDYAIPNLGQLSQLLRDWQDLRIYQAALTEDNYLQVATGPGGAYVLVPLAANASWSPVRAFARRLWEDAATAVDIASTKIVVRNSTGIPGAGTRLSEYLQAAGYRVGDVESGGNAFQTRLIDKTGGKSGLLAAALAKDLGLSIPPVSEAASNPPELVLELGYGNIELASLKPPLDLTAPLSSAGIEVMGTWAPAPAEVEDAALTPAPAATYPTASRSQPRRGPGAPVATAYATATPSPFRTPGGMSTPSSTATPLSSPSAGTSTPTGTATVPPSPTATPPSSPSPTLSPTPTPSPSSTPTQLPPTPTRSPTLSASTATPTPSRTPTPQATATATKSG